MRKLSCLWLLLVVCVSSGWQSALRRGVDPIQPPVAKKVPKTITLHGDTRGDDYFWLREKTNPEVIAYLKAENAYTDAMMKPTESLQERLYKEMVSRIKETDLTVPARMGECFYYSRTEQGKQYRIMCRKRGSLEAKEEVLLDLNALAKGKKFVALGAYEVSPDGNLLAYSIDNTGFRESYLFIKDLRTGRVLPDRLGKVDEAGVAWANDNRTLLYVEQDEAKRPYRLYRHALGTPKAADVLVYEEKDERFNLYPSRSRSGAYLFITLQSNTTSEVRTQPLDRPTEPPKLMHPREANHEYYADHHGDLFYIRTNDQGRNFRLVTAPTADPRRQNWKELVPHRSNVMLEGLDCFARHYVVYERENTLLKARITDVQSGETHPLSFSEPVYEAFLDAFFDPKHTNPEFNTTVLRFSFQSFTVPPSVYDYDMAKRERKLLKRTEVPGGYDPQDYQSERVYATTSDGTRIPISLVYKQGFKRDGRHPMLLVGYGSYGFPELIMFDSSIFSLLNRGFVYAVAHIRGGGEMGKTWHDQGRMMAKKNTFTDFIAAAEQLVAERYTAKDRLVIEGASAGGLLMGAVTNLRPDLFKAVVALVPFVDVLNTMMDPTLPLTVAEYEEWGNPNIKAEYDYIKSYSPYDNIERKAYPTILVKTSLNDSQVMYWEPAKYVAKLRAMKTDKNVLLLKTNLEPAGHGGRSGRYERLRETAFIYAFILSQVGIGR
jgi:oligopeptidase B